MFRKWLGQPNLIERLRSLQVREDIVQAAAKTAFGRRSDLDLPALETVVHADEVVLQLLEGRHKGATGLLVLTTTRVIFAAKGHRPAPTSVARSEVQASEWQHRRGMGVVNLTVSGSEWIVDQILGIQAQWFVERLAEKIPDGPQRVRDPLEELAELRVMYQAGAIGEDEFQQRKSELFRKI